MRSQPVAAASRAPSLHVYTGAADSGYAITVVASSKTLLDVRATLVSWINRRLRDAASAGERYHRVRHRQTCTSQ